MMLILAGFLKCIHFSVLKSILITHVRANLDITYIGLLFLPNISTSRYFIILFDPAAHFYNTYSIKSVSMVHHVTATPMLSSPLDS